MSKRTDSRQDGQKDTNKPIPLVLDFDGTLHRGDLTWEALAYAMRHKPKAVVWALWIYLTIGKAGAKLYLQGVMNEAGGFKVAWNESMLQLAAEAHADGRPVWVATGSPQHSVERILRDAGLPYSVMGTTDAGTNMTADNKARALVAKFGVRGFDYAGNSRDDLPVWAKAREAILVNTSASVARASEKLDNVKMAVYEQADVVGSVWRTIRPHQWVKNLLVFIPIFTAHAWENPQAWMGAALAFVAFSLCASGVYLMNDVMDLQDDRAHSRKCKRPMAAGYLPVPVALALVPLLTVLGFAVAWMVSDVFTFVAAIYVALTFAYSFYLKTKPMLDTVTLAGLYTIRVVAGAVAAAITPSFWLLLLALFGFYSLASMKRVTELKLLQGLAKTQTRGYEADDMPLVAAFGVASGMLAALVIALYVQSPAVVGLYTYPSWLGVLCPLAVWWLGRAWLKAWRGQMHDDPVVFALKDRVSWFVLGSAMVLMLGAM